jgi:hypothetical protein
MLVAQPKWRLAVRRVREDHVRRRAHAPAAGRPEEPDCGRDELQLVQLGSARRPALQDARLGSGYDEVVRREASSPPRSNMNRLRVVVTRGSSTNSTATYTFNSPHLTIVAPPVARGSVELPRASSRLRGIATKVISVWFVPPAPLTRLVCMTWPAPVSPLVLVW